MSLSIVPISSSNNNQIYPSVNPEIKQPPARPSLPPIRTQATPFKLIYFEDVQVIILDLALEALAIRKLIQSSVKRDEFACVIYALTKKLFMATEPKHLGRLGLTRRLSKNAESKPLQELIGAVKNNARSLAFVKINANALITALNNHALKSSATFSSSSSTSSSVR